MSRDPRETRAEARHIAWVEAHRVLGHRYWRWYVYGSFLRTVILAAVLAVAFAMLWHATSTEVLLIAAAILGPLLFTLGTVLRLSMSDTRARMAGHRARTPVVMMTVGAALVVIVVLVTVS